MREMLRPLTGRTSDLSPSNLLDGGGPTLGSPVRLMVTEFLMLTFSYLSTKYCSRSFSRPKPRAASGSTNLIKVCRKVIGLKPNSMPSSPRFYFAAAASIRVKLFVAALAPEGGRAAKVTGADGLHWARGHKKPAAETGAAATGAAAPR